MVEARYLYFLSQYSYLMCEMLHSEYLLISIFKSVDIHGADNKLGQACVSYKKLNKSFKNYCIHFQGRT